MSKNTLDLDTSGIEELINKLKKLEGDVKSAVTDALEQAAETVEEDTREAIQPQNLPALADSRRPLFTFWDNCTE